MSLKKFLIKFSLILIVFSTFTGKSFSLEPKEFVQSVANEASLILTKNFTKEQKIEKLKSIAEEAVDIQAFTYPGPKPYSKETAILMMADSAEASARSLKNPTAENIDSLIEKVINKQIEEDQFVNADITLKEITQLKKLFKKKLVNIHHARLEY